jgi:hypothetical protein
VSKIRVVDKQISALIACTDPVQPPATEGEGIRRGSSIYARMREIIWKIRADVLVLGAGLSLHGAKGYHDDG